MLLQLIPLSPAGCQGSSILSSGFLLDHRRLALFPFSKTQLSCSEKFVTYSIDWKNRLNCFSGSLPEWVADDA